MTHKLFLESFRNESKTITETIDRLNPSWANVDSSVVSLRPSQHAPNIWKKRVEPLSRPILLCPPTLKPEFRWLLESVVVSKSVRHDADTVNQNHDTVNHKHDTVDQIHDAVNQSPPRRLFAGIPAPAEDLNRSEHRLLTGDSLKDEQRSKTPDYIPRSPTSDPPRPSRSPNSASRNRKSKSPRRSSSIQTNERNRDYHSRERPNQKSRQERSDSRSYQRRNRPDNHQSQALRYQNRSDTNNHQKQADSRLRQGRNRSDADDHQKQRPDPKRPDTGNQEHSKDRRPDTGRGRGHNHRVSEYHRQETNENKRFEEEPKPESRQDWFQRISAIYERKWVEREEAWVRTITEHVNPQQVLLSMTPAPANEQAQISHCKSCNDLVFEYDRQDACLHRERHFRPKPVFRSNFVPVEDWDAKDGVEMEIESRINSENLCLVCQQSGGDLIQTGSVITHTQCKSNLIVAGDRPLSISCSKCDQQIEVDSGKVSSTAIVRDSVATHLSCPALRPVVELANCYDSMDGQPCQRLKCEECEQDIVLKPGILDDTVEFRMENSDKVIAHKTCAVLTLRQVQSAVISSDPEDPICFQCHEPFVQRTVAQYDDYKLVHACCVFGLLYHRDHLPK